MPFTRFVAIIALGFLGFSAVFGAVPMIVDPGGGLMHLPLNLLQHSPFHSFRIPGIVLLACCGLMAFWVMWQAILARPRHGLWIAWQGLVLLGWLVVQCIMLRLVVWPHYLYGALALVLIASGLTLHRGGSDPSPAQG